MKLNVSRGESNSIFVFNLCFDFDAVDRIDIESAGGMDFEDDMFFDQVDYTSVNCKIILDECAVFKQADGDFIAVVIASTELDIKNAIARKNRRSHIASIGIDIIYKSR